MKTLIFSALLTMSAFAQAKPSPLAPQAIATSPDNTVIESGPSGAMLESNYFNAPQAPFTAGRLMPCRLQLTVFEKTRLARCATNAKAYPASVFFTSATSCLSVNGFARNAYCSWLGRFLLNASSA